MPAATTVVSATVVGSWSCDQVREAFFHRNLPAGHTWPQPHPTNAQSVAALRTVIGGLGGNAQTTGNVLGALVNIVGFSAGANIAATIDAGATGAVALALYKRCTSNAAHGAGDCHQSPGELVVAPVAEAASSAWSSAVAAAGKVALTLLFVAIGAGMALLGLRQLAAPARESRTTGE